MKRFTDTEKWTKDKWFSELDPKNKLFWMYIIDSCDNVGVWEINMRIANFIIGYEYSIDSLLIDFVDKLVMLDCGTKIWIPSFIGFQHGALDLNSQSKPIQSYISLLNKHDLFIAYTKGIHTLQGKGKGKGKGKDDCIKSVESEKPKRRKFEYSEEFETFWKMYGVGGKLPAFDAWKKQSPTQEEKSLIIKCIPVYKDYCQNVERRLKDAQGWINGRFWETDWENQPIKQSKQEKQLEIYK